MTVAEQYVAAACLVLFTLVLAYVLIIAAKLQRLERAIQDFTFVREDVSYEPAVQEAIRSAVSEPGQQSAVEAHPR